MDYITFARYNNPMSNIKKIISEKNYSFINSSFLKLIALITMFIDHIGAGLLYFMVLGEIYPFGLSRESSVVLYQNIRHIGRIAFPLYCFLLVQGLLHTKNIKKYVFNMALFGLISEIFFDAALRVREDVANPDIFKLLAGNTEKIFSACNVYFTLLVGLIVIAVMNYVERNLFFEGSNINPELFPKYTYFPLIYALKNPLHLVLYLIPPVAGGLLCEYISSDYDYNGILLITVLYLFRNMPLLASCAGYFSLLTMYGELFSLPAFILMLLYSGKRGFITSKTKYFFYAFYPLHLLLIYILRCFIMN